MVNGTDGWSEKEVNRLKELRALGWSQVQIGHDLGRTRGSIASKVQRLGLPLPDKPLPTPVAPRPEFKPRIIEVTGDPVPFLATEPIHCRALFEQRGPANELMCCGMPVQPGRSYCDAHCDLYFTPLKPPQGAFHGKARYRQ